MATAPDTQSKLLNNQQQWETQLAALKSDQFGAIIASHVDAVWANPSVAPGLGSGIERLLVAATGALRNDARARASSDARLANAIEQWSCWFEALPLPIERLTIGSVCYLVRGDKPKLQDRLATLLIRQMAPLDPTTWEPALRHPAWAEHGPVLHAFIARGVTALEWKKNAWGLLATRLDRLAAAHPDRRKTVELCRAELWEQLHLLPVELAAIPLSRIKDWFPST